MMFKCLQFILLLTLSYSHAALINLKETVNLTTNPEVVHADLKDLESKDPIWLVGRYHASALKDGGHVVQFAWVAIQNPQQQVAVLEKPLTSIIKVKGQEVPAKALLKAEGDSKAINQAIKMLKTGKGIKPQKFTLNNPESEGRVIEASLPEASLLPGRNKGEEHDSNQEPENPRPPMAGAGHTTALYQPTIAKEKIPFQFQQARFEPRDKGSGETRREVCEPKVDEAQGRVYLQEREITVDGRGNATIGQCKVLPDFFDIKRDYACVECKDFVDYENKVAYTRYKKYYLNHQGQRQAINQNVYLDEENPHPFKDEVGSCRAQLDFATNKAYRQVQTVYYGYKGKRVLIEDCHLDLHAPPADILYTPQGCEPDHDYSAKTSMENHRAYYLMDEKEHQARGCHPTGIALSHRFDTAAPCKAVKHLCEKHYITMGRRYIIPQSGGRLYLSDNCEPVKKLNLLFEIDQSKGFLNNFEQGVSYPYGRYYYEKRGTKVYVSKVVVGPEPFIHDSKQVGFKHFDAIKESVPIYSVSIDFNGEKIILDHNHSYGNKPTIAYESIEETLAASTNREEYIEDCYLYRPQDKLRNWKRGDGSIYLEFLDTAETKKEYICKTKQLKRPVYEYKQKEASFKISNIKASSALDINQLPGEARGPQFSNNSDILYRYGTESQLCIKYPDGSVKKEDWRLQQWDSEWLIHFKYVPPPAPTIIYQSSDIDHSYADTNYWTTSPGGW
jgi:hypothetical protein